MEREITPTPAQTDNRESIKALPDYCKEWRISRGYTQKYIALKSGVSKSAISRFEKGTLSTNKILSGYLQLGIVIPEDMLINYIKQKR